MSGLDVNRALSANTAAKNTLYGTGSVNGSVRGSGFDEGALKRNLKGRASISVTKGVIKNFPLLAVINRVIKVTAGSGNDTSFDSLTGDFTIGGGRAHSDNVLLKAGELKIKARGDILLDLRLNLNAGAVFSVAKSKELTARLSLLKRFRNKRGKVVIPLKISGTVASPSIVPDVSGDIEKQLKDQLKGNDLLDKILGK